MTVRKSTLGRPACTANSTQKETVGTAPTQRWFNDSVGWVEVSWLPISTAPKDGTPFLAYGDFGLTRTLQPIGAGHAVTWWSEFWDSWRYSGDERFEDPTHWMPLPAQPPQEPRP